MMTEFQLKKAALCFAVLAFCLLALGSWLSGARILISFFRGVEAFCVFGLLAYGLGYVFLLKKGKGRDGKSKKRKKKKGVHLDQTA